MHGKGVWMGGWGMGMDGKGCGWESGEGEWMGRCGYDGWEGEKGGVAMKLIGMSLIKNGLSKGGCFIVYKWHKSLDIVTQKITCCEIANK